MSTIKQEEKPNHRQVLPPNQRIDTFWVSEGQWFKGTVTNYISSGHDIGCHAILFDDGETHVVDLNDWQFRILDGNDQIVLTKSSSGGSNGGSSSLHSPSIPTPDPPQISNPFGVHAPQPYMPVSNGIPGLPLPALTADPPQDQVQESERLQTLKDALREILDIHVDLKVSDEDVKQCSSSSGISEKDVRSWLEAQKQLIGNTDIYFEEWCRLANIQNLLKKRHFDSPASPPPKRAKQLIKTSPGSRPQSMFPLHSVSPPVHSLPTLLPSGKAKSETKSNSKRKPKHVRFSEFQTTILQTSVRTGVIEDSKNHEKLATFSGLTLKQVKQYRQDRRKNALKRGIPIRELFPEQKHLFDDSRRKGAFSGSQKKILAAGWESGLLGENVDLVVALSGLTKKQVKQWIQDKRKRAKKKHISESNTVPMSDSYSEMEVSEW